jgi:hypothetical protein
MRCVKYVTRIGEGEVEKCTKWMETVNIYVRRWPGINWLSMAYFEQSTGSSGSAKGVELLHGVCKEHILMGKWK